MNICKLSQKSFLNVTVVVMLMLSFFVGKNDANASEALELENPEASALVIFSSIDDEVGHSERLLDMAIGHFTDDITIKSDSQVTMEDVEDVTHLFYYAELFTDISPEAVEIINSFSGPTIAMGGNVNQLGEKFSFITTLGFENITHINVVGEKNKALDIESAEIINTEIDENTEVLAEGKSETEKMPLFVKNEQNYYYTAESFVAPFSVFFSQILHEVFETEKTDSTPGYIRLEDVHPLADPDSLMEIAQLLKEKDIPYMIAVIPVYTNPVTGREYHFNDSPDVLKALKYMQNNGGSVVLHGYTHQFRKSETGEGFEFWDVENDMPIYHEQNEKPDLRTKQDFNNQEEYVEFMDENKAFEREYIEKRLTIGIQELTNFGLYPLAFEAPHYTMSQNGYEVTSDFFSTYVGQVQLSDKDWRTMDTTPSVSKPSFLNGMRLLPETIGYVKPKDNQAIDTMIEKAKYYQIFDGGMVSGFYHPYLGVSEFKKLIKEMEQIPNIDWIDLKEIENTTQAENIVITTENGNISTDINQSGLMTTSVDFAVYHLKRFIQIVTWGIAGIGLTAVVLFSIYTVYQRSRRKQIEGG
ncbi:DUF2334 domain-containing protein [Halobacillus seohaensis]|uniref:DUF2334 domain-containing protein n=1 Tax=Halobacillus seohaensis TaxID=447421 RepID=A0ABW2EN29_9BACI